MSTLDEYKKQWTQTFQQPETYDEGSLQKMIRSRMSKHIRASMHYFWASLTLQILVYGLFSHVIIRYWYNTQILIVSVAGILLFIPFTIMLMRKFKALAMAKVKDISSVQDYILQQRTFLEDFFTFKRWYEIILIPLSSAIGVFLVFALYVPGGIYAFPGGALITYLFTLLSCYLAIRSENKKSFVQPINHFTAILDEYKEK